MKLQWTTGSSDIGRVISTMQEVGIYAVYRASCADNPEEAITCVCSRRCQRKPTETIMLLGELASQNENQGSVEFAGAV